MFKWFKKTSRSNLDYGKKIIGAEVIKESTNSIVSLAKTYLWPKKASEAKNETFQQAIARLSISELDLIKTYNNYVYSFYISLLFSGFCFSTFIYYAFFMNSFLATLSSLAILLICVANLFKFSFRAFQIKKRKLCTPNEWWNNPNDWFPSLNGGQ